MIEHHYFQLNQLSLLIVTTNSYIWFV